MAESAVFMKGLSSMVDNRSPLVWEKLKNPEDPPANSFVQLSWQTVIINSKQMKVMVMILIMQSLDWYRLNSFKKVECDQKILAKLRDHKGGLIKKDFYPAKCLL